jgi:hypothetical protein
MREIFVSCARFLCLYIYIYIYIKENPQCIGENTGAENIVKEIKQYQEKRLQNI